MGSTTKADGREDDRFQLCFLLEGTPSGVRDDRLARYAHGNLRESLPATIRLGLLHPGAKENPRPTCSAGRRPGGPATGDPAAAGERPREPAAARTCPAADTESTFMTTRCRPQASPPHDRGRRPAADGAMTALGFRPWRVVRVAEGSGCTHNSARAPRPSTWRGSIPVRSWRAGARTPIECRPPRWWRTIRPRRSSPPPCGFANWSVRRTRAAHRCRNSMKDCASTLQRDRSTASSACFRSSTRTVAGPCGRRHQRGLELGMDAVETTAPPERSSPM